MSLVARETSTRGPAFVGFRLACCALAVTAIIPGAVAQRLGKPFISDSQAASSGPGHPWQASDHGVNLLTLAKQTSVSLFGWTIRGGMPIGLSLHHNNQALQSNSLLGNGWRHSHDIRLYVWSEGGIRRAALVSGIHTIQMFRKNPTWANADGYRSDLFEVGMGYRVVRLDQVALNFDRVPPQGGAISTVADYRIASVVDRNGNAIVYQYDSLNRLVRVSDPTNRAIEFSYSANKLQSTRFVTPGGFIRTCTYNYDPSGKLIEVVLPTVTTSGGPLSYSHGFSYDAAGNITSVKDPINNVWQYGYVGNRIAWEQFPLNTSGQRVVYGMSGNTRTVQDPLGRQVACDFDPLGRVVAMRDPLSFQTMLSYSDPDFSWAASMVTSPTGESYAWDLDNDGQVVGFTDAAGERWDYMYNASHDLVRAEEPLVTNAWGMIEGARHRTDFVYDANGNRIQKIAYTGPATTAITNYVYDPAGQLTSVTDPLIHTRMYQYDAYGNLVRAQTPAGRVVQWHFDTAALSAGFTVPNGHTDAANQRTNVNRDEWGRPRVIDYPAGVDPQYHYDGMSRLVRHVDGSGQTDYVYDSNGRLTSAARGAWMSMFTYLPNGLRATMLENSGTGARNAIYQYDNRNLLQSITDAGATTQFTYDPAGRLIRRDLGNAAETQYSYMNGRLQSINHLDAGNLSFFDVFVEYQDNGLLERTTEGGNVTRYGYDFRNRVNREERVGTSAHTGQYTYDAAGNRTVAVRDGVPFSYAYDVDNLLTTAMPPPPNLPHTYQYDNNGRLVRRERANGAEIHRFFYDFDGRATAIERWNGAQYEPHAEYEYDALGRRVHRSRYAPGGILNATNDSFFDVFTGRLLRMDKVVNGNPATDLETHAGGLLSVTDLAANRMWPATDGFGNQRRATNNAGLPTSLSIVYNAFGEVVTQVGGQTVYQFGTDQGMRAEGDAGLIAYNGHAGLLPYMEQDSAFCDGSVRFISGATGATVGSDHAWGSFGFYEPQTGLFLPSGPNIGSSLWDMNWISDVASLPELFGKRTDLTSWIAPYPLVLGGGSTTFDATQNPGGWFLAAVQRTYNLGEYWVRFAVQRGGGAANSYECTEPCLGLRAGGIVGTDHAWGTFADPLGSSSARAYGYSPFDALVVSMNIW